MNNATLIAVREWMHKAAQQVGFDFGAFALAEVAADEFGLRVNAKLVESAALALCRAH